MRLAEQKLARDVEAWEERVDEIEAVKKIPSNAVLMLSQTPLVMRLLGTDTVTGKAASEGGIYAAPHMFDGTHSNMTPDMWKQIPAVMADPIAIFDSASPEGRARGDIVFMLDIKDANGATVIVPVALDTTRARNQARVNIVKSAYSKESEGVPSSKWFIRQTNKNARYINGQKLKSWQASAGVYFPIGDLHNTSGNKIFTEADLVNLKKEYSGHDQSRPEASESRPAAHPDNGRVVGAVSEETAKTLHLDNPGAIVLDDAGMRHIEERHSEEIRSLGFKDGREFVNCVLENLNAVHDVDGHGRKYDLVSKARTSQGRIMVRLEFAKDGDFYQVVTAKAVRENHFDKKTPLWESAGCAQM